MDRRIGLLLMSFFIILIGCEKDEIPVDKHQSGDVIESVVTMGSDYGQQLYFNIARNQVVNQNLKSDWDLGFESSPEGWHIVLNSSRAMAIGYTDKTKLSEVTEVGGVEWAWDAHSGNLDSTAVGNWQSSDEVMIVDMGYNSAGKQLGYFKMQIINVNSEKYVIRFGELKASDVKEVEVLKDYSKTFVQLSLTDAQQVDIEPSKTNWDLHFTQYTHVFEGPTPYLVSGVLINREEVEIAIDTSLEFSEITYENISQYQFESRIDVIGYDWKWFDFDEQSYIILPGTTYVVKKSEGIYYKMRFLDFYDENGEKGTVTLESQRL